MQCNILHNVSIGNTAHKIQALLMSGETIK